ncbi:MAG: MlaD family protein, partial [Actinomycetota bacterium]|nr:MlaD family protein [Actinomycetota bacterium]
MRRKRTEGDKRSAVRWGAALLVLVVIGTYLGFTKSVPFRGHYEIKAAFKTVNDLKPASPVRIAGVNVGKVSKIEHIAGGKGGLVTIRLDDRSIALREDAQMKIRPRIFLEGNYFIDVKPGSPDAKPLKEGATIPVQQTAAPVQFGELLTALQSDTRRDLQILLDEYGRGVSGRGGKGYNRSIRYWEGAYRDGAIVNQATLGILEHDLSGYVKNAGAVAAALDRNRQALKDLITDLNATARAFAVRDEDLSDAIAELPRTLRAGRPALAALNASFPSLRRFVKDFRPAVRSSEPALTANIPFTRQLRRLVAESELRGLTRDLRPTVPSLARLQNASVPLQEQVRLASSCQNEVILPWSQDKIEDKTFPTDLKVYEQAPKPLPGLAGESRSGDANGQWFRVLLSGGNYATPTGTGGVFLSTLPIVGNNPPSPPQDKRSLLRPDVPCETQQPPDLRSVAQPMPGGSRRAVIPASRQDDYLKIQERAVRWLRDRIKKEGLTGKLRVSEKPAT